MYHHETFFDLCFSPFSLTHSLLHVYMTTFPLAFLLVIFLARGGPHFKKNKGVLCPCTRLGDCGCGGSDGTIDFPTISGVLPVGTMGRQSSLMHRRDASPPASPAGTIQISDQTLLTVYKGNDASDRDGVANYGDLINDYRQGWSLWPPNENGQHVISYIVDDGVGNCERSTLTVALSVISQNSCVKFNQISQSIYLASARKDPALHITDSGTGCFASLGYRSPGENIVNIGAGCVNVGTVIHLVLHSLGMFHEHQRADRDTYVEIVTSNIDAGRVGGNAGTTKFDVVFGKSSNSNTAWTNMTFKKSYDYSSIMHNGPCHYSVSEDFGGGAGGCALEPSLRVNTMVSKDKNHFLGSPDEIGNRGTLSAGDVYMLSLLYPCGAGIIPPEVLARSTAGEATGPLGNTAGEPTEPLGNTGREATGSGTSENTRSEQSGSETSENTAGSTQEMRPWTSHRVDNGHDFWPAEPVPVTLSDADGNLVLPPGPDPATATTPETSLCTAGDAAGFSWSDRAVKGRAPKNIVKAAATKTGDAVTTVAPTSNPNESLIFQNYFREATSQRMMFLALGGIATLVLLSGIVVFFIYKRRKLNRTGLKATIEGPPPPGEEPDSVPLLGHREQRAERNPEEPPLVITGDTTDSEVYAEIMNGDTPRSVDVSGEELNGGDTTAPTRARTDVEGLV
jgi:hypothetical protein